MARSSRSRLPGMSRAAKIAGWCYLPVYLVGLNVLLGWLNDALRLGMDGVTVNIVYFAVNLAAVLIIFHSFLRQPFFGSGFWDFLQALILGAAIHYGGTFVIDWAAQRLSISLTLFNNDTVSELLTGGGTVMTLATAVSYTHLTEITAEARAEQERFCARIAEYWRALCRTPLAFVDTYGCQQNEADSERIRGLLRAAGYAMSDTEEGADCIVINTCAVREHAEDRVYGLSLIHI